MGGQKRFLSAAIFLSALSFSLFAQNKAGYELKFEDNFDGNKLNEKNWNYELHEPGWVNNELQSYIKSNKNIYVKNGNLVIQARKEEKKDGYKFTSGRINTQGKHDFKYGLFEARLKVPRGKGFLPAFWMMPTDESKYGSWPKCGEIDIMEVLGDKLNTSYATLHFGEPHTMAQKTKLLKKGNFADDFHVFACEWEPGSLKFYVDGEEIAAFDDWFTKKLNDDEEPYPAPYNQPFYLILNVAVGGNWPGYPDGTTKFGDNAQMVVDYVRVYQKKNYNENVTKKEEIIPVRAVGSDGNYVRNGDFKENESLTDKTGWSFMTQLGGSGTGKIAGNKISVETSKSGSQDYSIQLVQADIPLEKGYDYEFSFDAWSDSERKMKAKLCAPDRGWTNYFEKSSVILTAQKKHYSYRFSMTAKTDPNSRIDFNMGASSSTAPIYITNVKVLKLEKSKVIPKKDMKKDKNDLVYNGDFDFGAKQWEFYAYDSGSCSLDVDSEKKAAQITISDTKDADWKIQLMQKKVPLSKGKTYRLSFDAWSTIPRHMKYSVQRDGALWKQRYGKEDWTAYNDALVCELSTSKQTFTQDFTMEYDDDGEAILTFSMGSIDKRITKEHDVFLDNVKLVPIN